MANEEHIKIFELGVEAWNEWRKENPETTPDLQRADFGKLYLSGVILDSADLTGVNLGHANLIETDLRNACLANAFMDYVSLNRADLSGANLCSTWLNGAKLQDVNLRGAYLNKSRFNGTILSNMDLSEVIGLETIRHWGPSTIGVDTIYKSQGKIPEGFLRGCGVPDEFITYMRSLVNNPIEYYSYFISYSSKDTEFAERIYSDLQSKGVRCWFAPEDIKIGDKFRQRIDESIRFHDKLLLILSENSINSPWVENEVESALEREHKEHKTVLFPVRIDDSVMDTGQAWAASLRRTRHIGDFSEWKHHDHYRKGFERLIRDLKA